MMPIFKTVFWVLIFGSVGYAANAVADGESAYWNVGSTINSILLAIVGILAKQEFKDIRDRADEVKKTARELGESLGNKIEKINDCQSVLASKIAEVDGKQKLVIKKVFGESYDGG